MPAIESADTVATARTGRHCLPKPRSRRTSRVPTS